MKLVRGLLTVIGLLIVFGIGLVSGVLLLRGGVLGLLGISVEPTISAVVVLERVQALAELTTSRYNFSGMVTSERQMPPLLATIYGDRQVLIAIGYIEAGVDLSQIDESDIVIEDDTLTLTLPAAALQACVLDENRTYVAQRDTGIFAPNTPNLDTTARRFAIVQFRDQALEDGLLQTAQEEARAVISQLMLATNPGIDQVRVNFDLPVPGAPLPESCG